MSRVARQEPSLLQKRLEACLGAAGSVDEDVLYSLGSVYPGCILVAASRLWLARLQRAVDESGPEAILSIRHVFPIDAHAAIEVLQRTRMWVRICVHDGRFAGRTGFTIPEAVRGHG